MDISERVKSRPDLKSYFVKNATPTESNFAELVDSMLNQREDGLVKAAGAPVSIEATGNAGSQKRAINFYWDFADDQPHWVLSLNPRANPNNAATAKTGFSVSDPAGRSRLFIDRTTGNIGVSTVSPAANLDIAGGQWNLNSTEGDFRVGNDQHRFKLGIALGGGGAGDVRMRAQGGTNRLMLGSGTADVLVVHDGKVGVGTLDPGETLDVNGTIKAGSMSMGSWPANPSNYAFAGTNALDQAVSTNYALLQESQESGRGRTFLNSPIDIRFRIGNADRMVLANSGNVGLLTVIGTVRATSGVRVDGNLSQHVETDGAFYRLGGQVYITVDDNLYIRDKNGSIKFHFNTNTGILNQQGWKNASLVHGWKNYSGTYNPAGYFKDSLGIVHLRGLVKGGLVPREIFVLPVGYRPQHRELRVVCTYNNKAGRVDILKHNDGRVWALAVDNKWVSLDGISFRAYP